MIWKYTPKKTYDLSKSVDKLHDYLLKYLDNMDFIDVRADDISNEARAVEGIYYHLEFRGRKASVLFDKLSDIDCLGPDDKTLEMFAKRLAEHVLRKDLSFKEFCETKNRQEGSPSRYWHGAESHELINLTVDRLFNRAAEYIDWKLDERNNKL